MRSDEWVGIATVVTALLAGVATIISILVKRDVGAIRNGKGKAAKECSRTVPERPQESDINGKRQEPK